jgi:outer membrane protein OmpA-like peptidoglycan-associated protein
MCPPITEDTMRRAISISFSLLMLATVGCSAKVQVKAAAAPPPPPKAAPAPTPAPAKIAYIEISDRIQFEPGRAVILEPSKKVLDEVAKTMESHADLELVEIEGHTDWLGTEPQNLDLSTRRAEAVRDYLVSRGVAAARLAPKGYGEVKPIADNTTSEGRLANRRVTFRVVKQQGVESEPTATSTASTASPSAS